MTTMFRGFFACAYLLLVLIPQSSKFIVVILKHLYRYFDWSSETVREYALYELMSVSKQKVLQYFSSILKAIKFLFFSYDKTMWMIPIYVIFIKTQKDSQFYVLNSYLIVSLVSQFSSYPQFN
jgi:hypothetical protein